MSAGWVAALGAGGQGSGELWGALLRLLMALVVILPLVYGVTYLYSRRMTAGRSGRALKVIDAVHLGPNRSIVLLEVAGRVLVIGVTPHHIATLAEVTDPEVVRGLVQGQGPGVSKAFAKLLEARLKPLEKPKDGEEGN